MTVANRRDAGSPKGDILDRWAYHRDKPTMSRRLGLWIAVLALPLAALGLLLAEPGLDRRWEHHPSHFWLVLSVAGVNVALGLVPARSPRAATTTGPSWSRWRCWPARASWACTRSPPRAS